MAKIAQARAAASNPYDGGGSVVDLLGANHAQNSATLPVQDANDPFLLAVHPLRWQVFHGAIIPDFQTLQATPGANGCGLINGRIDTSGLVSSFESRGSIVLKDTTAYLRRTICTRGAHYHTAFEELIPGSASRRSFPERLVKFVADLIAAGKIPAPGRGALEILAEKVRERAEDLKVVEAAIAKCEASAASASSEAVAL
jgi:hypothetical protein